MTAISMIASICLVAVFVDRLRQISWCETKPMLVALYLSCTLWALSLVYASWIGSVDLHDAIGAATLFIFIRITRQRWASGAPLAFMRRSELQTPEL